MLLITFNRLEALISFQSMCEGMAQNAQDDHVSATGSVSLRAERLGRLMTDIDNGFINLGPAFPATVPIADDLTPEVEDVLGNLADNEDEDCLPGDVVLTTGTKLPTVLDQAVKDLFEATQSRSSEHIGQSFVSFVLEADHGSWDGVPHRDKAAMGRFITDFALWLKNGCDRSSPVVFTGSRYLTSDRPKDFRQEEPNA